MQPEKVSRGAMISLTLYAPRADRRSPACVAHRMHATGFPNRGEETAMARHHERYAPDYDDASDVTVEVKDGEVTLHGNVEQRFTKHRIEDIADDCRGVLDIHNEIRVQPRDEWPCDKGVAPGNANAPGTRPGTAGQGDNMMQSAIENMPPRE